MFIPHPRANHHAWPSMWATVRSVSNPVAGILSLAPRSQRERCWLVLQVRVRIVETCAFRKFWSWKQLATRTVHVIKEKAYNKHAQTLALQSLKGFTTCRAEPYGDLHNRAITFASRPPLWSLGCFFSYHLISYARPSSCLDSKDLLALPTCGSLIFIPWCARYRQDAVGQSRGRGSRGAFLQHFRLRVRGSLRRGRCFPGQGLVRTGQEVSALHHFHRRDAWLELERGLFLQVSPIEYFFSFRGPQLPQLAC